MASSTTTTIHDSELVDLISQLPFNQIKSLMNASRLGSLDLDDLAPLFMSPSHFTDGDSTHPYHKVKNLDITQASTLEILVALWYRLAAGKNACDDLGKERKNRAIVCVYNTVQEHLGHLLANECGLENWASETDLHIFLNQNQHKKEPMYVKPVIQ
jgi:hypothetical protein